MFCEAYNRPLSEAAASGEAPSPELQQHLASCDSCHTAFAEERSLFAAINAGLRASANSEVPATLIPRVHVALNNEHSQQPIVHKWVFASAVGAFALLVGLTLQLRHHEGPNPKKIAGAQIPTATSPRLIESNPSAPPALHPGSRRANNPETLHPTSAAVALSITPEVLVPDEERAAFVKFLANNQSTRTTVSAAVSRIPKAPKVLSPLEPVEIASLRVPSLEGEDAGRAEFEQIPSASQPSKEMK